MNDSNNEQIGFIISDSNGIDCVTDQQLFDADRSIISVKGVFKYRIYSDTKDVRINTASRKSTNTFQLKTFADTEEEMKKSAHLVNRYNRIL